ncbi:DNA helicase [Galliscardovia ingluviei]|uniref:DNA helicase n=1 Tax=Galliscardovia ingluviei TaxID=1769422 RepID=A0A8J3ALF1_9BIFI|nr:AAA family ATPase [Galliscardovia ingluviei]GGI13052.1 DNA helicase [Galliscardovia ingluviei]
MTNYASQIREEQKTVDRAYNRLDALRAQNRSRLDAVRLAGAHGSPTARTERDSFATMYEDRLMQLRAVEDRLVFGRLDTKQGIKRYIGRIGLSDSAHQPILIDWRADAARAFYEATPANHGDIVLRRHISLRMREVVGIEDEVLDVHNDAISQAASHGTLTGEGALMASLSSRRTGRMTDIVATIQGEQDRIIRSASDRPVVVQGGPGTGKTAVALHRAAYLLYTHRKALSHSGVLVVGPSSAFLHYIDQVLPSLGETGVVSRTIAELIPGVVATAHDTPRVAALKGDARMAQAIAHAVAARERIPQQLPQLRIDGMRVDILPSDIRQARSDARRTRQPHNKARETFVDSMLHTLLARAIEQLDHDPEREEVDQIKSALRMNEQLRITLNLAWLPMSAQWLLEDMWAKPHKLRQYAPWLSQQQLEQLYRPKGSALTVSDIPLLDEAMELLGPDPRELASQQAAARKREYDEQIAKETLSQAGIGNGIVSATMLLDHLSGEENSNAAMKAAADRQWTYGHIVIDEAQELTAMDWRMMLRRCPSRSFTIVGDIAQTSSLSGATSWQRMLNPIFGADGWDLYELTIDYRNPRQISDTATNFAQNEGLYVSTVHAVRDVQDSVEQIQCSSLEEVLRTSSEHMSDLAVRFVSEDGTGRIALVADSSILEPVRDVLWQAIESRLGSQRAQQLRDQPQWDQQIALCTPQEVKGLEFDAIVLPEPGLILENGASRRSAAADLYVSITRPTQRLVIVRTNEDYGRVTL